MDFIQIYNREANAWGERYEMSPKYGENWVLDKSTDSAQDIEFHIQGVTEPTFDVNDWVRILHVSTANEAASYDSEGLPLNHTQYCIGSYANTYIEYLEKWKISLALIEPTERAQGIIGESLNFTNQTSKVYDGITYTKQPFNHYTALRRWLMLTPANCDTYDSSYTPSANNISWYNRIKVLDKTWLESLPFADDTYNELSLFNVLMDNFDSSVGRTPCFYFDINPSTDLPYNNARDEYKLKFLRQDGFDKPILQWEDLTAAVPDVCTAAFDLTTKKEAANFAKGLVANVSNLSAGRVVSFPSEGLFLPPEVLDDSKRDTSGTDYQSSGDNWGIRLPYKISKVTKLTKMQLRGAKVAYPLLFWQIGRESEQVAVLEKKEYFASDIEPQENNDIAWFEEGSNEIHIRSYFYEDDNQTAVYNVEYEPLIDCRIEIGDMDFAQQVNQSSSQVDATKVAEFMTSYKDSMNKADISFGKCYYNQQFYTFANLIGSRVQRQNKMYMITNLAYQKHGLQYYVFFQLNEDHFRKNNSYQAPQNIRENIAISIDSVKDRRTFIKQTIKLGLTPQTSEGYQFLTDKKAAISALIPSVVNSSLYPQVACVQTSSVLTKSGGTDTFSKKLLSPIARFIFANNIMFNVKFSNNAIAGKKKYPYYQESDTILPRGGGTVTSIYPFGDIEEQLPILYTDPFGEVQKISCYFGVLTVDGFSELAYSSSSSPSVPNEAEFFKTKDAYYSIANLPLLNSEQWNDIQETSIISVENQNLDKSMLETFNETTGVEYLDNGVTPCAKLLEYSRLMRPTNTYSGFTVSYFSISKKENDDITTGYLVGNSGRPSVYNSSESYVNVVVTTSLIPDSYESIIISPSGSTSEKLVIINNPSTEWKNALKSTGHLKIYFA